MRLALALLLAVSCAAWAQSPTAPAGERPLSTIVCLNVVPATDFTVGRIESLNLSGILQGVSIPAATKLFFSVDGKLGGAYYRTAVPKAGVWALTLSPTLLDGSPRKVTAWYVANGAKVYLDNATPAAPFEFTLRSVSLKGSP